MPSTQNETLLRLVRDHGGKVAVASKAGTSRNTLDRALKGEPVHKSSLRKIASALGVTVEHLSSDADKPTGSSSEGRTPQRVWWTTSPTARLNLQMVARRYGVEPTTIFESAPILFAIAAEQSLRERRERLADIGEGLHALILDDLGERVPGLRHGVYRSETALGVEEASIRARDIDFRNEDADEPGNGRSPFVEFLADRIREFGLGEVEDSDEGDSLMVYGRGILHLGILIETMRREGYELTVGQPQVIVKEINGKKCEPYENLVVDVPQEFASKVIDLVSRKKGEMLIMETKGEMQHLEFEIPSRGLIGLRTQMLTATTGEAVMAHRFTEYKPWKGPIPGRGNGVLLSKNTDKTTGYSIDKLQDRGSFFVEAAEEVYAGQIIAENIKPGDLVVNATEPKKLTNHRASGSDDATRIQPKTLMTLEECMEYIQQDECIEVTPNFIRMRKVILNEDERKKVQKKMEAEAV